MPKKKEKYTMMIAKHAKCAIMSVKHEKCQKRKQNCLW